MADKLAVKFAKVVSRERLPDRILSCGFFETDDPKKLSLGRVFYFLEIVAPWFPNTHVCQSIISTLNESFYQQSSLDTALNLENALRSVNARIADMAGEGDHDWISNLNGLIGVVKDKEIHLSQVGLISGYLIRQEKISQITDNLSLKKSVSPLRVFEQLISGSLETGDRILLANSQLFNHISVDRIRLDLQTEQIEVGLEQIFRHLKKIRAKEVNVLSFEIDTVDSFASRTLSNCPSVFYLDLPLDTKLQQYKKTVSPYINFGAKIAKHSYIGTKKALTWTHTNFKTHVIPKITKLAGKSKEVTLRGIKNANKVVLPQIRTLNKNQTAIKLQSATGPYFKKGINQTKLLLRSASPYLGIFRIFWVKENRKYLFIGLTALILIFGFLKIRSNSHKQVNIKQQEEIANAFDQAKSTFDTAKVEVGLKRVDVGRQKLAEALVLASKAQASAVNKKEATDLYNQIQVKIDELNLTQRLSSSQLFADQASNTSSGLYYMNNFLYYLSASGKLSSYNVKTKEEKVLASLPDDAGKVKTGIADDTNTNIYFLTDKDRVFVYKDSEKTFTEAKISDPSGKWEQAVSIDEFAGNLYLLDSAAGIVWKHTVTDAGYSKGKDYLDTTKVSIKDAVDMTINGDIYILGRDGSVKKFSKGLPDQTFALKPAPAPDSVLTQPKIIISGGTGGELFVTDASKNRVLYYNKNGDFVKQFASGVGTIKSLAVNVKAQKIWFLVDNKIYESGL